MTPQHDAILAAGQEYVKRLAEWLQKNPNANEATVALAMANGEIPIGEPRGDGRPTKLNETTHQIIIDAVREGAYYEDAANAAGVEYRTLRNWCTRGERESERRKSKRVKDGTKQWEHEEKYFQFFHALKKAEGDAVIGNLAGIGKAAKDGHWQAYAWKLERRYPKRYGRHHHTADITSDGKPIPIAIVNMDVSKLKGSDE